MMFSRSIAAVAAVIALSAAAATAQAFAADEADLVPVPAQVAPLHAAPAVEAPAKA